MPKKEPYTLLEINWLDDKVKQIQQYIDENPLSDIGDRIETVTDSKGRPVIKVIAKKEDAQKAWLLFLKEFNSLLVALEVAREIRAAGKLEERKGYELKGAMKKFVQERT